MNIRGSTSQFLPSWEDLSDIPPEDAALASCEPAFWRRFLLALRVIPATFGARVVERLPPPKEVAAHMCRIVFQECCCRSALSDITLPPGVILRGRFHAFSAASYRRVSIAFDTIGETDHLSHINAFPAVVICWAEYTCHYLTPSDHFLR